MSKVIDIRTRKPVKIKKSGLHKKELTDQMTVINSVREHIISGDYEAVYIICLKKGGGVDTLWVEPGDDPSPAHRDRTLIALQVLMQKIISDSELTYY